MFTQTQGSGDLNSSNSQYKTPNIMEAAYRASQVGTAATATAAAYGYQMAVTPGAYSVVNTGSINNPRNETTGYVNANEMYQNQRMSNNAAHSGLYNSGQYQFSGSFQSNPAEYQSNYMEAYHRNLLDFQGSSMGYQRNSMGYQGNSMSYRANTVEYPTNSYQQRYQTSYNQSAVVAHPVAYQYENRNYYDATAHTYPNQQSTSGFSKQSNWHKKGSKNNTMHKKAPPKPQQVHYCDVCKISCTSSNTYREHLEGQQHKRKEIMLKTEVLENQSKNLITCKLCIVTCPGNDAYNSHIRGAKHQKAILLLTKLGKEIPAEESVVGNVVNCSDGKDENDDMLEDDIQPVGQDYLEEIKNEMGIIVNFKCKLCDCQFSDKNAQNMHMKGRRHRMQYKKKVDPNFVVDTKLKLRRNKHQDKKLKKASTSRYPQEESNVQNLQVPIFNCYSSQSRDDCYIMAKHMEIYPKENEIQAILRVVLDTEKALKFVSEELLESKPKDHNSPTVSDQNDKSESSGSVIQGVWRLNNLAKSLLLHKETTAELVVMCSERPTFTMLQKIVELLPEAFKKVKMQCTYSVLINTTEAGLIVSDNDITVLVQLTNLMLQEERANMESNQDNLSSEKCSQTLTSFKRTKWFLNTVTSLPYCSEVILVLRDLCQKVPTLMPLNCWILELLVERVISSVPLKMNLSPTDIFRQVMESISSGIFLTGGPGLIDPCEKEDAPNAIEFLSVQQREDITAFAQNALRRIAFGKIHEVLMMDHLPIQNDLHNNGIAQKRPSCEEEEICKEKKIKLTSDDVPNTVEVTQ